MLGINRKGFINLKTGNLAKRFPKGNLKNLLAIEPDVLNSALESVVKGRKHRKGALPAPAFMTINLENSKKLKLRWSEAIPAGGHKLDRLVIFILCHTAQVMWYDFDLEHFRFEGSASLTIPQALGRHKLQACLGWVGHDEKSRSNMEYIDIDSPKTDIYETD